MTNASVTARDEAKGLERTTSENTDGQYHILLLPPGQYTVTVQAPGFATATVKDVAITVGQMAEIPIALSVAGTQEVINVSSAAELVETQRTSSTDTIDQRRIDNLPINGRNYINFALTDSQVVRDNAPSIGAAPTSGLNMSGQRARANLVNVDGADATDNSTNGVRSTVSQEAVQEFQIITNGYAAEYGRAAGGVVNIITRSGSNDFHGDVYGYLAKPQFSGGESVQHGPRSGLYAGAGGNGVRRADQEGQDFLLLLLRRSPGGTRPDFPAIGANNFGLVPFDTTQVGQPFGTVQLTPQQIAFLTNPAVLQQEGPQSAVRARGGAVHGAGRGLLGMALKGAWPAHWEVSRRFPERRVHRPLRTALCRLRLCR